MATYRLYAVDGAGHIGLAEWVEAASDEDALAEVRRMKRAALKWEVWQGHRLVATLDTHHGRRPHINSERRMINHET